MPAAALRPEGAGQIFNIPQPTWVNVTLGHLKSDPARTAELIVPVATRGTKKLFEQHLQHASDEVLSILGGKVPTVMCTPCCKRCMLRANRERGVL